MGSKDMAGTIKMIFLVKKGTKKTEKFVNMWVLSTVLILISIFFIKEKTNENVSFVRHKLAQFSLLYRNQFCLKLYKGVNLFKRRFVYNVAIAFE